MKWHISTGTLDTEAMGDTCQLAFLAAILATPPESIGRIVEAVGEDGIERYFDPLPVMRAVGLLREDGHT